MSTRSDRGFGLGDGTCHALAGAGRIVRGVFRLMLAAGLILGLIAIVLGRSYGEGPRGKKGGADLPIRVGLPTGVYPPHPDRFLDPETGRPVPIVLPGGGTLWGAGWAPWRDDRGRTQVVGRWCTSSEERPGDNFLVRLSQPDGAVLDRLPLDALPHWVGAPCWFPDRSTRILLAGGDSILYRVDFGDGRSPRLRPLPWRAEGPPVPVGRIDDLSWPRGPRLGGRLLASLVVRSAAKSRPMPDEWRIWWLRLDGDSTEVVAAGPLADRGGSASPDVDERHAALSPDEPARLAWLERDRGRNHAPWRLRIAPIEFDEQSGAPSVRAAAARTLAEDCASVAPSFSADGRHLAYVPALADSGSPMVRRLVITDQDGPPEAEPAIPDGGGASPIRIIGLILSIPI